MLCRCEFCNNYLPIDKCQLFRYSAITKQLYLESNRAWEFKQGVRHICENCMAVIKGILPPSDSVPKFPLCYSECINAMTFETYLKNLNS